METIQVLSFFAYVLIVIVGAFLLFPPRKSARIMSEMNQLRNNTEAQFNELREKVKAFTQD